MKGKIVGFRVVHLTAERYTVISNMEKEPLLYTVNIYSCYIFLLQLKVTFPHNVHKVKSRLSETVCSTEKPVAVVSCICDAKK